MMASNLPPVLQGRSEFGNRDQIEALQRLSKVEEHPCKWIVEVEVFTEYEIMACSEDEAIEQARLFFPADLQGEITCTAMQESES